MSFVTSSASTLAPEQHRERHCDHDRRVLLEFDDLQFGRRPAHDLLRHTLSYVPLSAPRSLPALTVPSPVYTFLGESS